MSGLSQSQAYVGLAVAVLLGVWTLSSKKRSSRGNECSSDNSPSVIISDATSQSSEVSVRITLSTVRCIGQLHPAALLQENKGLDLRDFSVCRVIVLLLLPIPLHATPELLKVSNI
jgi:hypothetical protein